MSLYQYHNESDHMLEHIAEYVCILMRINNFLFLWKAEFCQTGRCFQYFVQGIYVNEGRKKYQKTSISLPYDH